MVLFYYLNKHTDLSVYCTITSDYSFCYFNKVNNQQHDWTIFGVILLLHQSLQSCFALTEILVSGIAKCNINCQRRPPRST
jgi:hypothetical protein